MSSSAKRASEVRERSARPKMRVLYVISVLGNLLKYSSTSVVNKSTFLRAIGVASCMGMEKIWAKRRAFCFIMVGSVSLANNKQPKYNEVGGSNKLKN